jgi:hypothetical protein
MHFWLNWILYFFWWQRMSTINSSRKTRMHCWLRFYLGTFSSRKTSDALLKSRYTRYWFMISRWCWSWPETFPTGITSVWFVNTAIRNRTLSILFLTSSELRWIAFSQCWRQAKKIARRQGSMWKLPLITQIICSIWQMIFWTWLRWKWANSRFRRGCSICKSWFRAA